MAKLEIKFELNNFPVKLIIGNDDTTSAALLNKAQGITELVSRIGGKAPGQPDTDHRCKASYLKCDEGEGKYAGKIYFKVYGVTGSWIHGFGVPIWPEIMTDHGFNPEEILPGQRVDLTGYDVVFSLKVNEAGKENPGKVTQLIKVGNNG